jgi:DNA-binding MarR family transcriptional regulator
VTTRPQAPAAAAADPIVDALVAVSRIFAGLTARTLGELDVDLSLSQYRTLVILVSRGAQRTVDLAGELGVTPSTATRICDRLVRRGLVRRFHRATDRRVAWLGLTAAGKELVGVTMRRRRAAIVGLVDRAGLRDLAGREAIGGALAALAEAGGEVPDAVWWEQWSHSGDED